MLSKSKIQGRDLIGSLRFITSDVISVQNVRWDETLQGLLTLWLSQYLHIPASSWQATI